ncbi:translation initiation factor eIF-2B subunit family protein [Xylariaceae sp. FL1651]|nr:translation initiation factor eIF-2B subunit family protein [Xylariaceae sp. FL1651]
MTSLDKSEAIKKRAVAGSFLFKIPNGDEKQAKVALFKRSNKVRTYQHKLAPLSGSVEEYDANPLATALREIQEETTLPPSSLELLRVGKPYTFTDDSVGREWTINPFAFRLREAAEGGKGEEGIVLDWEHEAIEWHDPLQVSESDEFGGVPKLVNSLRRVWPAYDLGSEVSQVLINGIQILRDDHEHGARELAGVAVSTLRDVISQMGVSQPIDESWWSKVRMAAWHICQSRRSMGAAITSAIVKALNAVRIVHLTDLDASEKIWQMTRVLDQQLTQRISVTGRICQSFIDYVRSSVLQDGMPKDNLSILTLSSSSTISGCLSQAASNLGVVLDLRILESRPLCEGVTLASKLLEEDAKLSKMKITIFSDASVALAANGVDLVLLGADRINLAGHISNKIGSLPAVLSARHVIPNVKVLILSDTEKIAGPGSMEEHESEENDPSELSQAWGDTVTGAQVVKDSFQSGKTNNDHSKVSIRNPYFEWVPSQFIDAYATEEGLWSTEQIQQRSDWIGKKMEQLFDDL